MEKTSNKYRKSSTIKGRTADKIHSNTGKLSKTYASINHLHKMDIKALKTHNVEMFVGLVTEDCIMLPPALKPLCGREAIRNYLEDKFMEWKAYVVASFDQEFDEIRVIGDMAYEWGTSRGAYYMKNGGPDIFENSRIFRILRHQPDGSWKIARAIWNDVP
jgi:uncharacterized protein (TIGR02246 family)